MTDRAGPLTEERRKTHGRWFNTSRIAQSLKGTVEGELAGSGRALEPHQQEALEMILAKIARIISGDPNHKDHWDDIAGYAMLGRGE